MKIVYQGTPRTAVIHAIAPCQYRDWYCRLGDDWLQVAFPAADADTGEIQEQRGRKWRLSPHMVRNEIVQTLFLAISVAEEHERRESFLFRGERIFGPHHNLDALAVHTSRTEEELRDPQS